MHAASSSCFPSAVHKGGLRLSACLTEINSHSAGEEDAGIVCVGYRAVFCQAGARVSTRSTWTEPKRNLEAVPVLHVHECTVTADFWGCEFKARVI